MKPATILLCLCGSLILAAAVHGQDPPKFDLSTDEGVNAAREAVTGKRVDPRSTRCIRRHADLPGIVMVGGFASDYGCRLQGAFVGSRYLATDDKALSRSALEALGWQTANPQQREKLAQAWVARGLLGFLTVLVTKNEDFANHSFQPPQAVTRADGTTAVTLWMRLPSGRVRGTTYQLREYRFSSDGDFAGNTTLENFTATKE